MSEQGHATPEEQEEINRQEAYLKEEDAPVEHLVELGVLYIEPYHRVADAIAVFERVLERVPRNIDARFWLAYCCVHYLMDDAALRKAVGLLEAIIQHEPAGSGHAYLLLAEALEDQGRLSADDKIRLLEASVKCEPEWVYNRQSLAWVYRDTGRFEEALIQIEKALDNIREPDSSWSPAVRRFEQMVTGRNSSPSRLIADFADIQRGRSKR
jgi:tetratricopeptide (TPR) repeat protein